MSTHTMLFLKRILPPFSCSLTSRRSFSSTSKLSSVKSLNEANTETKEEDCRRRGKTTMSQFLLNECGFSDSQILAMCGRRKKLFKAESIGKAQQAVQLFKDYGFNEDQVRKIVSVQPNSLQHKVDTQLKPTIEFLKELGFTGSNLGHFVSRAPRFLVCSLEHYLSPKVSMLVGVFGSKLNLCKTLMRYPRFLTFKIDDFKPNIDILKQSNMEDELLLYVIGIRPSLLSGREDVLRLKIECVRNLDVLEGSKAFANALAAVDSSRLEIFENKLKIMVELGLLENEILQIARKFPIVLGYGIDRLKKSMEFLKNVAGFQPNIVVSYPRLLSYSVENRLRPRHKVIDFLRETEPSRLPRNLASIYEIGEKCFADKSLMGSSESANLFEKYKGKSVNIEVGADRKGV